MQTLEVYQSLWAMEMRRPNMPEDSFDEKAADAVNTEDGFEDDRAADQRREFRGCQGEDGNQRVPEGMLVYYHFPR